MKLLEIRVKGLKLFRDELVIDFFAQQRVGADKNEMLYNLFSNIYLNNVLAFVGINASGKTSILKVVSFVMEMLNNKPINNINSRDILNGKDDKEQVVFEIYFSCKNNTINKLVTVIEKDPKRRDGQNKFIIVEEKIWSKDVEKIRTKKSLLEFKEIKPVQVRSGSEEYLMEDVSIIIALNRKNNCHLFVRDVINLTNYNIINFRGEIPPELITFLDPSIEYLNIENYEKDYEIKLKFKQSVKEIIMFDFIELNKYLSSGTIKGINIFLNAIIVFKNGGYLLVDELENHFNKEIVATLIRFFMNTEVNYKGATLVFSTHYSELLDEFERNDNIYIIRNEKGIAAENLAQILKRNDIKKSEAYQSGYLQGTVPSYKGYVDFKNAIIDNRIDEVQR